MYNLFSLLEDTTGEEICYQQGEYSCCCPFHIEDHPSFSLNSETEQFHCFSCGVGGRGMVEYMIQLYNISYYKAFELLYPYTKNQRGSFPEHERIAYSQEQQQQRNSINLQAAQDYYQGNFHGDTLANQNYQKSTPGFNYLYSRGFLSRTLEHFHCIDWLRFPEHSIFIPLAEDGEVYGYMQRRTADQGFPKYLSMPGLDKQQHLYSYRVPESEVVLVSEGAFDQWLAWQYGFVYSQASILGSSVSSVQAEKLATYGEIIISGFDMDEGGEKAHASLVERMRSYNKKIIRLVLPTPGISLTPRQIFQDALERLEIAKLLSNLGKIGEKASFSLVEKGTPATASV